MAGFSAHVRGDVSRGRGGGVKSSLAKRTQVPARYRQLGRFRDLESCTTRMSALLPDEFSQEAVYSERVQVQLGAVENRGAVEENRFLIDNAIVLPHQTHVPA